MKKVLGIIPAVSICFLMLQMVSVRAEEICCPPCPPSPCPSPYTGFFVGGDVGYGSLDTKIQGRYDTTNEHLRTDNDASLSSLILAPAIGYGSLSQSNIYWGIIGSIGINLLHGETKQYNYVRSTHEVLAKFHVRFSGDINFMVGRLFFKKALAFLEAGLAYKSLSYKHSGEFVGMTHRYYDAKKNKAIKGLNLGFGLLVPVKPSLFIRTSWVYSILSGTKFRFDKLSQSSGARFRIGLIYRF